MGTIGVGITTRNRPDILEFCCAKFLDCSPELKILVVDDNSDDPDLNRKWAETVGDYFYSEKRLGVANAKNQCIKMLDVDHLFLFDDDCFPVKKNWYKPWVEAGLNHMIFACRETVSVKKRIGNLTFWNGHHGCMLYFSRKTIETIGGFEPGFGLYGFEHSELTWRIKRAGLIPHDFISPTDTGVWSFDAQGDYGGFKWPHRHSIPKHEIDKGISGNRSVLFKSMKNPDAYRKI